MSTDSPDASRFETEFSLLSAMYPNEITLDPHSQEVTYTPTSGSSLCLRIPSTYPSSALPELISAQGPPARRSDLRNALRVRIQALPVGEEALDAILRAFEDVVSEEQAQGSSATEGGAGDAGAGGNASTAAEEEEPQRPITAIIYLHHLLALSKRKAVLSPPSAAVSGITKPGYPGVLVFSGPETAVRAHVRALREMNWQAFQVRAELEGCWRFAHGEGVRECESMAEVVGGIVGEGERGVFLGAMRMK